MTSRTETDENEITQLSISKAASTASACQEDYSPCTCNANSNDQGPVTIDVTCNNVPSFAAVQTVFRRSTTARQITSFWLTIPYWETNNTLPSDFLNTTATRNIYLTCPSTSNGEIRIDPKAFSASADYAQSLTFVGCDLARLNYIFIKDLYALSDLYYSNVVNFSPSSISLPYLPSLSKITVVESSDFENFNQFPVSNVPAWSELSVISCPKFQSLPTAPLILTKLAIESCPLFKEWDVVTQLSRLNSLGLIGFDEETISKALDVIISSPLMDNIIDLNLNQNGLTKIPPQIKSFSQLENIYLMSNDISSAENGSLSFNTPNLNLLKLSSNVLAEIESAAFQGKINFNYFFL